LHSSAEAVATYYVSYVDRTAQTDPKAQTRWRSPSTRSAEGVQYWTRDPLDSLRQQLFPRAGHFVFFGTCTAVGRVFIRAGCGDPDGTDRDAVHAETIRLALEFFTVNLR
jgi:hypothetical protein